MQLLTMGINHTSASVEIRERVAFAPEQMTAALADCSAALGVPEVLVLSTCNRTELTVSQGDDLCPTEEQVLEWLAAYHNLSIEGLRQSCYAHYGSDALRHLVQVASGLDSMVLGEPQIMGQMKSAYAVAQEAGTVGVQFSRLFPSVFAMAKKVRTDTAIGENPVSVAYAAVSLAGRIFTDLKAARALLVGAGETIELVARHLVNQGVERIVVANRTLGHASELAQRYGAEAVMLSDIPDQLISADIVISSTASQLPILGKGAVENALRARRRRPMLMIDLAVPRDIESQVGELDDIYLYSVDDLKDIVDDNVRTRQSEALKADEIIAAGIESYLEELRALGAVDTVKAFRGNAEALRDRELKLALRLLARGEPADKVLTSFARGLTNKLIHHPTQELKRASANGEGQALNIARRFLGVDHQAKESAPGYLELDEENS
ncbi:MAG: glutamyl-tRNA reductase [Halieaceae bacterium]|jgi:glutamyl-tRNA reductase